MQPDPETTTSFLAAIPFIGLMTKQHGQSPIATRLFEAGIIGGIVLFGTVEAIGKDIQWLKDGMHDLKAEVVELRKEVYQNR